MNNSLNTQVDQRYTSMGAKVALVPSRARLEILAAFRKAGARYIGEGGAAELLGVSETTFREFVKRLGLKDELAKIRAKAVKEGWHHGRLGGRPRKGGS